MAGIDVLPIVALAVSATVAVVGLIGFLLRKAGEVSRDSWQIPADLRMIDINGRKEFNGATGNQPDEPITLERVIAAAKDSKVLATLQRESVAVYTLVNELKERNEKYRRWGRILRLGRGPKPLTALVEDQPDIDIKGLQTRIERLEHDEGLIELFNEKLASLRKEQLDRHNGSVESLTAKILTARQEQLDSLDQRIDSIAGDQLTAQELKEQIERLNGRVEFLSADLIRARQETAITSVNETANTIVNWLQSIKGAKAGSCIEFVNRKLAATKVQIGHSDSPMVEVERYNDEVIDYLNGQGEGFNPFIDK